MSERELLSETDLTPDHCDAMLCWFDSVIAGSKWNLSEREACVVLGGISKSTYQGWMNRINVKSDVVLPADVIERISLLLGIHKALSLMAPEGQNYKFFSTFNSDSFFSGKSVKEYLLLHPDITSFYNVRKYLGGKSS